MFVWISKLGGNGIHTENFQYRSFGSIHVLTTACVCETHLVYKVYGNIFRWDIGDIGQYRLYQYTLMLRMHLKSKLQN